MANTILTYSWLKFTHTLLFTTCVTTCIQISNIEVFIPAENRIPVLRTDVSRV